MMFLFNFKEFQALKDQLLEFPKWRIYVFTHRR